MIVFLVTTVRQTTLETTSAARLTTSITSPSTEEKSTGRKLVWVRATLFRSIGLVRKWRNDYHQKKESKSRVGSLFICSSLRFFFSVFQRDNNHAINRQMTKMNNEFHRERLGINRLNDVLLKIYLNKNLSISGIGNWLWLNIHAEYNNNM